MLALKNRTPFAAAIVPGLDREDYDTATVLVKGTFSLRSGARRLPIADEQAPITRGDEHHGDPATSSIRRESDTCPAKPGADIVLTGHAYAPPRKAESVDVALSVGRLRKVVRVFGDRRWFRAAGRFGISRPLPFDRMPLVYERAFGGADTSDPDPTNHVVERRNPVGTGLSTGQDEEQVERVLLPNLEDPAQLIESPGDRPPPAGFGVIGRAWLPRALHAGTYDDAWRAERFPFLPADFDERYHQAAHPDLIAPAPLAGGEPVVVQNASELGELRFSVPDVRLTITTRIKGVKRDHVPRLDTLHIEPDERRVVACFRITFRCPRSFLYLEEVLIREAAR
ncbi:hypothetical protein SOCE26_048730 [Sorangium cellulosum]|uniref:DUF2169 domain-containing protein n=1 Tax=Sorangium cellulosum TaxID=56 RepID=A0A2L0EVY2_SORCE|nr:DUF2169 domain-containing protein [Sorangium cellulosum]AUX43425.1 hypothetical protein SOCE26_048730 [Sorangium cellulosum]